MIALLLGICAVATFFAAGASRHQWTCPRRDYYSCEWVAVNGGMAWLLGVLAVISLLGAILLYQYEAEADDE